jgi:hypothetical protein
MSLTNLNSTQQTQLKEFIDVAGPRVGRDLAIKYLTKAKWSLEQACNNFWEYPPAESELEPVVDKASVLKAFSAYGVDGEIEENVAKFYEDIGVSDDDVMSMVIPWKFGAKHLGIFTEEEFVKGMANVGCATIAELKAKVPLLRSQLDQHDTFKPFYQFCFAYTLSGEGISEKKVLSLEFAISAWRVILKGRVTFLDDWIQFLEETKKKAINKDTWDLFWDFHRQVKSDFSNYDPAGAWPSTIDEFVDYMASKKSSSS